MAVKDRLAQRGRIDRPIGRLIIIHHVEPEPLPDRPSVFKRRHHGFIRAPEHAYRPEPRFGAAFAGDVDHRGRPIPVLGFHAAESNVRPLPDPWGEQVRKLARDRVRNGHAVNPELEIRVVLPDVDLFEAAVGGAGNGEQGILQGQIITPWQRFNVSPADGIRLTGRIGLNQKEGGHDFQRNVFRLREGQHDGNGLFLADRNHHVLAPIGILNGLDGKDTFVRNNQRKLARIGCGFRCDQGPFLIPQFHGGLGNAPQIRILHVPGNRLIGWNGSTTLRHSPQQRQGDSEDEPYPPSGLNREQICHRHSPPLSMILPLSLLRGTLYTAGSCFVSYFQRTGENHS